MRDDDLRDWLLKAEGLAEIAAEDAGEKVNVLSADGLVETESVAELCDIFRASAFAKHLFDGIARDDVSEKKNHRDDEPKCGEGEHEALNGAAEHL